MDDTIPDDLNSDTARTEKVVKMRSLVFSIFTAGS